MELFQAFKCMCYCKYLLCSSLLSCSATEEKREQRGEIEENLHSSQALIFCICLYATPGNITVLFTDWARLEQAIFTFVSLIIPITCLYCFYKFLMSDVFLIFILSPVLIGTLIVSRRKMRVAWALKKSRRTVTAECPR